MTWEPKVIAQAIWDDRNVAEKARRIPSGAKLYELPSFSKGIHPELCKVIKADPPKGYEVQLLDKKRGECKETGLAIRAVGRSGLPLPKEPFRFLCLCTPQCAYKTRPEQVNGYARTCPKASIPHAQLP